MSSRVVGLKLPYDESISETVFIYSNALQYCIDTAWKNKIKNAYRLQPLVYKHIRSLGLHSQLACACIKQSCSMVKKAKTKPAIKRRFMKYNSPRSFSYKKGILSIATIHGRKKFPVKMPKYAIKYNGWKISESILTIDKKNRIFFHLCLSKDIDVPLRSTRHKRILGVDVGIKHLAVTSDGRFYGSVVPKMRKHQRLVAALQSKGTKSAKRHLRRLSGRWTRFMRCTNHQISKEIVEGLEHGDILAMEKIKHIRSNKGRRFNRQLHNWAFAQLQSFMEYKAIDRGIVVAKIDPAYTSKTCSRCGYIGIRTAGYFHCSCGYSCNADLNASFNIRNRVKPLAMTFGLSVSEPIVADDERDYRFHDDSSSLVTSQRALAVSY